MKTEFKTGQKVWDEVNFPNKEGLVEKLDESLIYVRFNGHIYCYGLNGVYANNALPTLKSYPYTVEFKEKKFEPVVGQYYYFWDNGDLEREYVTYGKLTGIFIKNEYPYCTDSDNFENISENNPLK
jgi:hypothetical protein